MNCILSFPASAFVPIFTRTQDKVLTIMLGRGAGLGVAKNDNFI